MMGYSCFSCDILKWGPIDGYCVREIYIKKVKTKHSQRVFRIGYCKPSSITQTLMVFRQFLQTHPALCSKYPLDLFVQFDQYDLFLIDPVYSRWVLSVAVSYFDLLQLNLNSSNTDASFTMANSNSFFESRRNFPIDQENKYFRKLSYFMKLYVECTH